MVMAFIFPGQGSQYVGMGKLLSESFVEAREVFQEVDDTLNQKLSALMFEGDEADLRMTSNTQPALMAVSIAALRVLEKQGGVKLAAQAKFVAGHSLGEYAALTGAGTLSLKDCARLLRIRGDAMQSAVPVGVGAMSAILGMEFEDLQQVVADASTAEEKAEIANDNASGQIVISGHAAAVERSNALALERGAKKAVPLPVSAPFHCSLMQPAAEKMAEALAGATFNAPSVPVVINVRAEAETAPDKLRAALVEQVTGSVRWRESVLYMKEQGVEKMVEIGAGKVLSGLAKRIDRDMEAVSIETPEQIDAFLGGEGQVEGGRRSA